jgi:peptidoglycan hydrolase-like protein with peptidoglycan-binding domain
MAGMRRLILILLCAPLAASASGPFTSLHPEQFVPPTADTGGPGLHESFISQLQAKLNALGFYAGEPNGDFGGKTQAALAQFQLSRAIPAGGQLDDRTLDELGLQRPQPNPAAGG